MGGEFHWAPAGVDGREGPRASRGLRGHLSISEQIQLRTTRLRANELRLSVTVPFSVALSVLYS